MTETLARRLGVCLVVSLLGLALSACGDHEDTAAATSKQTSASDFEADPATYPDGKDSYPDIRQGDCFDHPALFKAFADGDFSQVTPVGLKEVPCSGPHDFEDYHEFHPVPGDEYPGEARLDRLAQRGCAAAFRTFVGKPARDSSLGFYHSVPSANQWRAAQEDRAHQAWCVIYQPGQQTTGTLEHSRL